MTERFWVTLPVLRGWRHVRDYYRLSQGLGYIGGSYAAFMASNVNRKFYPSDVDIFATSPENAAEIEIRLRRTYACAWEVTPIATTFFPGGKNLPVQVVKPHPDWHNFPNDILNSFDFDVSRAVLVRHDRILADQNIGLTEAKILGMSDPLRTLQRTIKYGQKGVSFPTWELIKLFKCWDELTAVKRAEILARVDAEKMENSVAEHYTDFVEDDYWEGE